MPKGRKQDTGAEIVYGTDPCPRCGKIITRNGWGRKSHIVACLKRTIKYKGRTYPPATNDKEFSSNG